MNKKNKIEVKILNPKVGTEFPLPTLATTYSAGFDIRACIDTPITLVPEQVTLIPTGMAIFLNRPDVMAMLAPRSGLATKHGIILANTIGIIDGDYQNQLMVPLINRSEQEYIVDQGERICQLIIVPILSYDFEFVQVSEFSPSVSNRKGGFGSTGKN